MKDIRDYTVGELLETGAKIEVKYHEVKDKEDAVKKVSVFGGLNRLETNSVENTHWVDATESSKENIDVTAFYKK